MARPVSQPVAQRSTPTLRSSRSARLRPIWTVAVALLIPLIVLAGLAALLGTLAVSAARRDRGVAGRERLAGHQAGAAAAAVVRIDAAPTAEVVLSEAA
jgi:hypothetical protein